MYARKPFFFPFFSSLNLLRKLGIDYLPPPSPPCADIFHPGRRRLWKNWRRGGGGFFFFPPSGAAGVEDNYLKERSSFGRRFFIRSWYEEVRGKNGTSQIITPMLFSPPPPLLPLPEVLEKGRERRDLMPEGGIPLSP